MPKKKSYAFNPTQIKDGRIVRLRKDQRIKSDLGPYLTKHPVPEPPNKTTPS